MKQLKDLAGVVLWDKKKSAEPIHHADLAACPAVVVPQDQVFSMTNLAKSQANTIKVQQQQLQRIGSYGAHRSSNKDSQRAARIPATATSSTPKKSQNQGIQVCPAFSKGEPCPRGGDSSGSCKASNG